MNKIKIGVIGVGYLGRFHAEKYNAMADVELVGVADSRPGRALQIAQEMQTRHFNNYHEMLGLIDAVSIVVPTRGHAQAALDCLDYGLDIFIEKPMTVTMEEADAIISKAESCQRLIQVGHIERFNPAVMAMEQYITNPIFIEAQRLHAFNPRGADVDVTLDLMIHDLDIILNIVKSPLKHVLAMGTSVITDTSDMANARLVFENGCTANLTASRVSKTTTRKLRIFQQESYISLDYGKKEIWVSKQLPTSRAGNGLPRDDTRQFTFTDDALETELKAFVLNIRERTTPMVSGREGRLALKIAHQIIELINDFRAEHPSLITR